MCPVKTTLKVKEIDGEIGRYHVESHSEGQMPYLVDLLANDGIGQCSCIDFQTRCWPNYKANAVEVPYGVHGRPNRSRTECKHLHVVRKKFYKDIIRELIRRQKENEA